MREWWGGGWGGVEGSYEESDFRSFMCCLFIFKRKKTLVPFRRHVINTKSIIISSQYFGYFRYHRNNTTQRQKTYLRKCAPSEASDQPSHSRSLVWIFTGRVLDSQGCRVSSSEQSRHWSDCAYAQADLSSLVAHVEGYIFWCFGWYTFKDKADEFSRSGFRNRHKYLWVLYGYLEIREVVLDL